MALESSLKQFFALLYYKQKQHALSFLHDLRHQKRQLINQSVPTYISDVDNTQAFLQFVIPNHSDCVKNAEWK